MVVSLSVHSGLLVMTRSSRGEVAERYAQNLRERDHEADYSRHIPLLRRRLPSSVSADVALWLEGRYSTRYYSLRRATPV